jgi:hypothetical protein
MRKFLCVALILAIVISVFLLPQFVQAQIGVSVSITTPPPLLPVYTQPYCPGPDYIWTPGYWAWGPDGYFWVPGTWVRAPRVGFLWTPGYWGWGDGVYVWHVGYWGPHVGFYGGVDYGFGYGGEGYEGGYWRHGAFVYNTSVNRVSTRVIHNTYHKTVVYRSDSRASYNGGRGGIDARPTAREEAAARDRHLGATSSQNRHETAARSDLRQLASENHGRPSVAASRQPGQFNSGTVGVHDAEAGHATETRTRASETRTAHTSDTTHHAAASGSERTPAHTSHAASQPHNAETHANRGATPHNTSSTPASTPHTNAGSGATHGGGHAETHTQAGHSSAPKENTRQEHNSSHTSASRENSRQEQGSSHGGGGSSARSAGGGSQGNAAAAHGGASHGEPK